MDAHCDGTRQRLNISEYGNGTPCLTLWKFYHTVILLAEGDFLLFRYCGDGRAN